MIANISRQRLIKKLSIENKIGFSDQSRLLYAAEPIISEMKSLSYNISISMIVEMLVNPIGRLCRAMAINISLSAPISPMCFTYK
jgi:hypothetical protein